ncbi:TrbI/VirB10 family protein [Treponema putidum]|uniref:TrbI/VirB10 family protein n=1 Tax=Treponema putidum TaxID=221027 RepID=UPI003D907C18
MSDENNIFDLDLMSQSQNENIEGNDYSAIDNETSVSPDTVLSGEDQHISSNDDILKNGDNEKQNEAQQTPSSEEDKNEESKKSPDDVIRPKKKGALKLNRQLILTIVVCLFLALMLITFLSTGKKESKKDDDKIKSAGESYMPDFEAMAASSYNSAVSNDSAPDVNAPSKFFESDEEALIASANSKMPDLNEVGKAPVSENKGGSGSGYSRPDTRNNPIQKQIQGIKGLTPTGRQNQGLEINQFPSNQEQSSTNPYSQFNLLSKEDFVKQMLASQGMQGGYLTGYGNDNDNSGKENFHSKNIGSTSQGEFLNSLSLWQGTVIPAVLVTGINTDLPGNVIARVTKNIYSSLDGRFLLIPQGTLLFADYNSSVSYAQNRIQVAWTYMIRPDGFAIQLGNMGGVDNQGFAGYKGRVNNHPWAFLKGMLLMSAISIADTDLNAAAKDLQTDPYAKTITERLQDPYKKITNKIIDRALDIQPTITIKSGIGINILTNTNLFLPPVEIPEVTQKYIRH